MYIVAKDGSGEFTSIQAAIDALPLSGRAPAIVLVQPGVYQERVVINKDNVRLIGAGETSEDTVITHSACAKDPYPDGKEKGTFLSFTVLVSGRNVEMEHITIRNDAGDGRLVGQAVALYAAGDRGVYRQCRLIAHQDTLFCGPTMPRVENEIAPRKSDAPCVDSVGDCPPTFPRQYFEECFIQGDVDFIFGPYRCWFEKCTLFMNDRGGWYTAANTPEEQPYGLVFHRCLLTGACGEGQAYLGRPWRKFARTLFIDCEMDAHVSPQGFYDWDEERPVTERLGESGTTGPRADQSLRHPQQKRLTAQEAQAVTLTDVLGSYDAWQPDRRVPTWFLCGDSTMADYIPQRYPMMGWGQKLPALLPEGFVQNCAINGRSSRSFIEEQRLAHIAPCLRPGDKLVIGFAHNDEKDDPRRCTTVDGTFPQYLSQYIDTARQHGAEPILVTPIARRNFDAQGRLTATHGEYPTAIRKLAKERNVPLVDLENATMALFQRLGEEGTRTRFCHVQPGHPNYPDGAADNTHLQESGAVEIAALFLSLLRGETALDASFSAAAGDITELLQKEDSVME
ncbi:MAG: hypothetical protein IJ189_04335 [Clostridia bacterium]|nr:hypothetical protein [Clostridia bacterium]